MSLDLKNVNRRGDGDSPHIQMDLLSAAMGVR